MTEEADERRRILRLVAEGQISPEDAADLLEAVEPEPGVEAPHHPRTPEPPVTPQVMFTDLMREHGRARKSRNVVIQIREGGESKVNLRIPMNLTKAAGKFLPRQAQQYLGKYDINLPEFLEDLAEADSGAILEVKDGENKVLIAVE